MHVDPCLPPDTCNREDCHHCCHITAPTPVGSIRARGCLRVDHSATNTFPKSVVLRKGILDQPAPGDWEAEAVKEQFEKAQQRAYEKEKREGRAAKTFKKLRPAPLLRRMKQVLGFEDYVGVYVWDGIVEERDKQMEQSTGASNEP